MNAHFALPGGSVRLGSPMATPELDEAIEVDVATSETSRGCASFGTTQSI